MTRSAHTFSWHRLCWWCALLAALLLPGWAAGDEEAPSETAPEAFTGSGQAPAAAALWPVARGQFRNADRPILALKLLGDLRLVNEGGVSPWYLERLETPRLEMALGLATLKRSDAVGDMLAFAGRTFIRTTDPKTGPRVIEAPGPVLSAFSASVVLPDGKVYPRVYRVRNEQPQLLHTMLEELANESGMPIGVLGWVEMPDLNAMALKRAPVHGEALFGTNTSDYLQTIRANDAHVVFFAVAVPAKLPRPSLNAALVAREVMGYDRHQGKSASALISVYGATVDKPAPLDCLTRPLIMAALRRVQVQDILRVQGSSTVLSGNFFLYRLNTLGN